MTHGRGVLTLTRSVIHDALWHFFFSTRVKINHSSHHKLSSHALAFSGEAPASLSYFFDLQVLLIFHCSTLFQAQNEEP
jgi:hypothetical protein